MHYDIHKFLYGHLFESVRASLSNAMMKAEVEKSRRSYISVMHAL